MALEQARQRQMMSQTNSPEKIEPITVTFQGEVAEMLRYLAEVHDISEAEAARRSVATQIYLSDEVREGATLLIQKPNNTIKELVLE